MGFLRAAIVLLFCCLSLLLPGPIALAATPSPEQAALYQQLEGLFQQAMQATQTARWPEAEQLWTQAIDLYPNNPAAWSNRGNSRVSQFKLAEAIADFDKAIELAPEVPDPYTNRGTAKEGLKDWAGAIADYNKALELAPKDPVAYNNRGNAQGGAGDWEAAKADFSQAAQLSPGFSMPNLNYAMAQFQLGDRENALRQMRSLVRRYPTAADPRAALTAMLWDKGLRGEAESNWVAVAGLDKRYQDLDWLANIRRWPPTMVTAMAKFLQLR
jgi:tetratricopeptide (TPR) repeat protein